MSFPTGFQQRPCHSQRDAGQGGVGSLPSARAGSTQHAPLCSISGSAQGGVFQFGNGTLGTGVDMRPSVRPNATSDGQG